MAAPATLLSTDQFKELLALLQPTPSTSGGRVKVEIEKFSGEDPSLFKDWERKFVNQIRHVAGVKRASKWVTVLKEGPADRHEENPPGLNLEEAKEADSEMMRRPGIAGARRSRSPSRRSPTTGAGSKVLGQEALRRALQVGLHTDTSRADPCLQGVYSQKVRWISVCLSRFVRPSAA